MAPRHLRHRGAGQLRFRDDRPLLRGRPRPAGARGHDMWWVGHRSRHGADTGPTGTDCIQPRASLAQGACQRALTSFPAPEPMILDAVARPECSTTSSVGRNGSLPWTRSAGRARRGALRLRAGRCRKRQGYGPSSRARPRLPTLGAGPATDLIGAPSRGHHLHAFPRQDGRPPT